MGSALAFQKSSLFVAGYFFHVDAGLKVQAEYLTFYSPKNIK